MILDIYKLFGSGPNHFDKVQISFFWTNFYNLDLTKMNWTPPQRVALNQSDLDGRSKIILDQYKDKVLVNWYT